MSSPGPEAALTLQRAARQRRQLRAQGLPPALFLTDPARTPDAIEIARRLPRGWGLVLRHFGQADWIRAGQALRQLARRRGLIFLIANDAQLATVLRADGVHWPYRQRHELRRWRRRFRMHTISAHSTAEWRGAARLCPSAIVLSTAFRSQSPTAGQPLRPMVLRRLCLRGGPTYALGGVNADTVRRLPSGLGFAMVDGAAAFSRGRWGEGFRT